LLFQKKLVSDAFPSLAGVVYMIRSFVFFGLLTSAAVAVAQPAGDPAPAPTAAKPAKEKKICRALDDSTSRLPKRVCRTAQQWEDSKRGNSGEEVKRD
jgi:hypothetical protein